MKYYIMSENADPDAIDEPKVIPVQVTRKKYRIYKNIQKDYFGYEEKLIHKNPKVWKIIDDTGFIKAARREERKPKNV